MRRAPSTPATGPRTGPAARFRRTVPAALAAAALAGAALASTAAPASAAQRPAGSAQGSPCTTQYTITSQSPTGFTATLAVTNTAKDLPSWEVVVTVSGDLRLVDAPRGNWDQTGSTITGKAAETLASDDSVSVNLAGQDDGSGNPRPTAVTLNGATCPL